MTFETILTPERGALLRSQGWWKDKTINDYFAETLAANPDKTAIVTSRQGSSERLRFTYRELDGLAGRIAASLRSLGVGSGDVVSMQLPNSWEFIAVALAASRIGAVVNPLMHILRERELTYMLGFCEAKVFIVPAQFRSHDHAAMARAMLPELPALKRLIVVGEAGPDGFEEVLLGAASSPPVPASEGVLCPDDVALLMYSSGTTGSPKGVMHTSNTLLSTMVTSIEDLQITTEDVALAFSPFGHLTGYAVLAMLPLMRGNTIVVMDTWDALNALDLARTEKVTYTAGATPFLNDLVETVDGGQPSAPTLRVFLCAGAPIPPVLVERADHALNLSVCSVWGMTECAIGSITRLERALELSSKTDGCSMRGNELKVVDAEGKIAPLGETGRLLMRGASQFVGYLKRPDLNAIDAEGWLDSGDLAYVLNEEGYIRINGRSKDIVIRGGENVPVVEIEALLMRHPAVAAAAIVGYPDERLAERACAFIVVRSGQTFDMAEMQRHLSASKTAKHFWPERLVICNNVPMTATGKIQKFKLKEQAAAG
ncbi:AMP-binding protein [Comamonas testosteroni]|uniref:AMP-binding protein n=1 Tax=Comamonas testosteroni TaxID=285 RepID=UPI0026F01DCE|nr:AMP-binding protein [Comamonas testosteroni]